MLSRKTTAGILLGSFVSCIGGVLYWSGETTGNDLVRTAQSNALPNQATWDSSQGFVVHEWGTFTSFSGSDGAFMEFRPLAEPTDDLPEFVRTRTSGTINSVLSKSRVLGKVRMETPVLYFYSDEVKQVQVSVEFPEGLLTEFYPPVKTMMPPVNPELAFGEGEPIGNSSLDWGTVTIIPAKQIVPQLSNMAYHDDLSQLILREALPQTLSQEHYGHARETDAAWSTYEHLHRRECWEIQERKQAISRSFYSIEALASLISRSMLLFQKQVSFNRKLQLRQSSPSLPIGANILFQRPYESSCKMIRFSHRKYKHNCTEQVCSISAVKKNVSRRCESNSCQSIDRAGTLRERSVVHGEDLGI